MNLMDFHPKESISELLITKHLSCVRLYGMDPMLVTYWYKALFVF